jgi:hemerythrin
MEGIEYKVTVIEFSEELLTGIPEMDEQHKKLVELLNKVVSVLREGRREEARNILIRELLDYVESHLTSEEEFLKSIGYPDYENHKKAHDVFRKEVQRLVPHVKNGDEKAFRDVLFLTWGWVYNHIAKTDKKYGLYAKEMGFGKNQNR